MHSPYPGENAVSWLNAGLSYVTSPCIGLFFMISGALLLDTKDNMNTFISKRLRKMILPTAVWSVIYLFLESGGLIEGSVFRSLFHMLFNATGTVLWFMYTLLGLYIITPILAPWAQTASAKDLKFALMIWGLTLFFPLLKSYHYINTGTTGPLYYMSGFAGYYVAGYAILKRGVRFPMKAMVMLSAASLFLCFGTSFWRLPIAHDIFWYLGICTVIPTLTLFQWIAVQKSESVNRWISQKEERINLLTAISLNTFGIYLIHILLMRQWLWKMDWFVNISNYYLQTVASFVITLSLSYLIARAINKFKITRIALSI